MTVSKPIRGRYQDPLPAYDFSDKSPRNLSRGMEMFRWVADRLVWRYGRSSYLIGHRDDIKQASYLGLHTALRLLKFAPKNWWELSRACESSVRREMTHCADRALWPVKPPSTGHPTSASRRRDFFTAAGHSAELTDVAVERFANTAAFDLLDEEAPEPLSVDDLRGYIDVTDRNWAIFQRHFRDGASASEISKEFNITERHIVRIYGRVRDDLVKHATKNTPAQAKLAA